MSGKPPSAHSARCEVPQLPVEEWTRLLFARPRPEAAFEAAEALVSAVARILAVSLALAESGRTIDLGGLDGWVGRLTAGVIDLDPPDGRRLRPALVGLLDMLGRIETALLGPNLDRPDLQ